MATTVTISNKDLCRILSADKSTLNEMELALREAMEAANSDDDLIAIREKACISSELGTAQITSSGKVIKI